jgi:hypothetical protein
MLKKKIRGTRIYYRFLVITACVIALYITRDAILVTTYTIIRLGQMVFARPNYGDIQRHGMMIMVELFTYYKINDAYPKSLSEIPGIASEITINKWQYYTNGGIVVISFHTGKGKEEYVAKSNKHGEYFWQYTPAD